MNIDPKKMALINEFKRLSEGKSSNELLPLALAIMQKSKEMNIKFTNEESDMIIDMMLKNSTNEEKKQVKTLLNMIKK